MRLRSGAVLPSGLMDIDDASTMGTFDKNFRNFSLKQGAVIARHDITSTQNLSKIYVEYDVAVTEQDSFRGTTITTYKNVYAMQGFGSVADFFEYTYRPKTKSKKGSVGLANGDQDGSQVLVLCLDGVGEKAIIVGALQQAQRTSKIKPNEKGLYGAFNGINFQINNDGSASLTFKGATDNSGKVINEKILPTTIAIAGDGAVTVSNGNFSIGLTASGAFNIAMKDAVKVSAEKDISVSTKQNLSVTAEQKMTLSTKSDLALQAQGSATFQAQSIKLNSDADMAIKTGSMTVQAQNLSIQSPQITLQGLTFCGGPGGLPALNMITQMVGFSATGPVISTPVGPFATQTFVL